MADALELTGLSKAQAVFDVMQSIGTACASPGLENAVHEEYEASGELAFRLNESLVLRQEDAAADNSGLEEKGDLNQGPGVRVRRRRA